MDNVNADEFRYNNSMYKVVSFKIGLVIVFLLMQETVAFAQTVTDDMVNDVAKGLFCPVCESEPLDTCATQACQDWRDEIRAQLEAGSTKSDIFADFQARYGDRVLAEPPAAGFNLALWLTIPLALLIGGYFFIRYLRRLNQAEPTTVDDDSPPRALQTTNDYIQQIEDEVRNG